MSIRLRNKILIVTAVWQRHDLTKIVLSYYGKLAEKCNGKLLLLAAGSEGEASRDLCNSNGWDYIESTNDPVSMKWASVVKAARKFDFDFLIIVGSDDLLSLSLIRYYDKTYSGNADYMLGLGDLYFYMMTSKKSYHFHGYASLQTIGAGRCISRNILNAISFRPWGESQLNRGLDSCCSSHLKLYDIKEKAVKMQQTKGVGIDVKHYEIAITDSSRVIARSSGSDNILKKNFPSEYKEIMKIKFKAGQIS